MNSAATTHNDNSSDSSKLLQLIHAIPDSLSEAYDSQLGAIQRLAENTDNFQDINTFKDACQSLSQVKPSVLSQVARQFTKQLNDAEKVSSLAADKALNFHTDLLSIVTDSEIDYQLMLEKGFTDSNHNFSALLAQSGWKFCHTAKESLANAQLECIRPGVLAFMLQDALDHFIEDKQVARIAYRFIGAKFFTLLKDFYHEITPELTRLADYYREQEQLDEEIAISSDSPDSHAASNDLPVAEVSSGITQEDVQQIKQVLGTNIDVTGLIKNWDIPAHLNESGDEDFDGFTEVDFTDLSPDTQIRTASVEDVSHLLKQFIHQHMNEAEEHKGGDVRSALKESLSQLSDEGILTVVDRVSENVLNLVSHLFDSLNEAGNFIDEVQDQMTRLQAPVMQVALADTKLFQSNEHPIRQYLNQVSSLGVRISESSEEGFIELRDSVSNVLKEFNGNADIFETESASLTDYIEGSIYAIKHVDGNFEAKEFAKAMKHTAISDFLESQNHLLEKELTFHKLIKYVWGAILARIIRRHGNESAEWKSGTETYSTVLWSTQVEANDEGKREVLRTLPKVVPVIRSLFTEYNLKTELRDAILDHMIQLHLAIIRGTDGKDITETAANSLEVFKYFQGNITEDTHDQHQAELDAVEVKAPNFEEDYLSNVYERFDQISPFEDIPTLTQKEEVVWEGISANDEDMIKEIRAKKKEEHDSEDLQAIFARLNQLPLDSIFVLTIDNQETRCKLTKKSFAVGTFTFKAFDSELTIEKNKGELALDLIRGHAKQIDEHNIFDNALERVVMQIQASHD